MDQQVLTNTSKKGDYWFLDRSRLATRLLTVALALAVMALGAACSAGNQGFADATELDASRETSLLGGVLGTVTGVVTGTVDTVTGVLTGKWYIDEEVVPADPAKCPFTTRFESNILYIKSTRVFDKVELYYTDGSQENFSLYNLNFSIRPRYGRTLDGYMIRLKADGSKWFFDSGKWFVDVDSGRWYGDVDSASTDNSGSGSSGSGSSGDNSGSGS
jgi:hypothetical protein